MSHLRELDKCTSPVVPVSSTGSDGESAAQSGGSREGKSRISLYQYWDQPIPPDEVVRLMASWASDPAFDHHCFDQSAADKFIETHCSSEQLNAFRQCAIPAMQADFFRYAVLYVNAGIYVDADIGNAGGLADLCANEKRGLLLDRRGRIANDILFFRDVGDPLVGFALDKATENILQRTSNIVWEVTGPAILTRLRRKVTAESEALFRDFGIADVPTMKKVLNFQWDMEYKKGLLDWRNSDNENGPSIFTRV